MRGNYGDDIVGIGDTGKGGWWLAVWNIAGGHGIGDFKDGFETREAAIQYARREFPNLEVFERIVEPEVSDAPVQ